MNKESLLGEKLIFKGVKAENRPNFKIKFYLRSLLLTSLGSLATLSR